ncbi:MAG: glycine cleavage T C-terminal barrel domain-containing protein [Candidatus Gastranaerophilales bacterium]
MNQIANGVEKKLIALQMIDKPIARHGYGVYFNNEKIGEITSGCPSPTLGTNIALAYVKNIKEICLDATIQVMIREKLYNAKVVSKPFIKKRNKIKL